MRRVTVCFCRYTGWFSGRLSTSANRLDGKVAVVTGGNAGIGKVELKTNYVKLNYSIILNYTPQETVLELARRGAKVIIGCRDVEKSQKVAETARTIIEAEVIVVHLDLADNDSVRKFAEKCLEEERIDLLINNAGLMMPKHSPGTKQGFEVRTSRSSYCDDKVGSGF